MYCMLHGCTQKNYLGIRNKLKLQKYFVKWNLEKVTI